MVAFIGNTLSWTIFKTVKKLRQNSSRFVVALSSRITCFSSFVVCVFCRAGGRFFYKPSFKNPRRKKYRTLRSGDRTGHVLLLSLTRYIPPPIRCHWRDSEMAWYYVFLGVRTLSLPPYRRAKVFWNVSAVRHSVYKQVPLATRNLLPKFSGCKGDTPSLLYV